MKRFSDYFKIHYSPFGSLIPLLGEGPNTHFGTCYELAKTNYPQINQLGTDSTLAVIIQ